MKKREITRLFFGKEDTSELAKMARQSETIGFTSIPSALYPKHMAHFQNVRGKVAILRGGFTGSCIPAGAKLLADNDAHRIIIRLREVRASGREPEQPDMAMQIRAFEIAEWFHIRRMPIERMNLVVTPRSIWKKVLRFTK